MIQPSAISISEQLFVQVKGIRHAIVECTQPGTIAGLDFLKPALAPAPAGKWELLAREGQSVQPGDPLVSISGTATELNIAEDYILGPLGFSSGIATRAKVFQDACPEGLSIACGGWKKLPAALKPLLRAGLNAVGLLPRLVNGEFVYMSKNAITLFGGVESAIRAGIAVNHGPVAVQVRNVEEALFAVSTGAGVIMVDTANLEDLESVNEALTSRGLRHMVTLAFGGGVKLNDLPAVKAAGAEAVDVGRDILDAPLLDLRVRVCPQV